MKMIFQSAQHNTSQKMNLKKKSMMLIKNKSLKKKKMSLMQNLIVSQVAIMQIQECFMKFLRRHYQIMNFKFNFRMNKHPKLISKI